MRILAFAVISLLPLCASAFETLAELRHCVSGNVPEHTARQDLAMTYTKRTSSPRQLVGRLYVERDEKDLLRSMIKLQQPRELFNAAYLFLEGSGRTADKLFGTAEDRTYVFLPAARRARKISASSAGSDLFGTNIETDDIRHLLGSLTGGTLKQLDNGEVAGRSTYTVEITPFKKTATHSRVIAHIDTRTCLTLQADFYKPSGKLGKRLTQDPSKISQVNGRFAGHSFKMESLDTGEITELFLGSIIFDRDIPETIFHPDGFYQ